MSILNHSAASEMEGQQYTWSSPFSNSRRSAENNRCPCISLSLTSQRHLIFQQRWSLADPSEDCLPTKIAEHDMIESFHTNMKGTVQFNGSSSRPFDIRNGVRQRYVLAPALFRIYFVPLLSHVFGTALEGICLRTRSDGRLFNLGRLRDKTKVREVLIRNMLFADCAAVTTHTQQELQVLMGCFSQACKDFGRTISLKKTNVLGQDIMELPSNTIDDYELDVVEQFTYLGSTRSIRGLGRQPQHLLASLHECGPTPN